MNEKEVLVLKADLSEDTWNGLSPDIVVGIDFGMTYTGKETFNGGFHTFLIPLKCKRG